MKTKLFYKIFAFTFGMMLLITVLAHVLIFMIAPSENLFLNKALPFHRRAEFFAFNTGTTLPLYPFNINRVFYCTKGGKVIDF